MVSIKIIEASGYGYVESQVNKYLKEKGFAFSNGYKLHYSTSRSGDSSVSYSVLIEYEDN